MKLYELAEAYSNILDLDIEDADVRTALEAVEGELETKLENMAKLITNINSDSEALKAEETRLQAKRKALENKVDGIKQYMEDTLMTLDGKKVKTTLFNMFIQKNAPSVDIKDEKLLPQGYLIPVEPKIDKASILKDLKEGKKVPGAELKQTESLRIR